MAVGILLATAMWLVFDFAPEEQTMGVVQKIVYVHVAVAWFGLLAFIATAVAGLGFLVRRDLGWDHWARAWAEVGWLCSTLTLITGSLWAHEAWNTWWTWDPRLTSSLILWTLYAGYFLIRGSLTDGIQQALVGAVLAIVGVADVPLVIMATRWFRGVHPESPGMEPSMHWVLLGTVVAFTVLFVALVVRRRGQLVLIQRLDVLEEVRLAGYW